MKTGKPSLILLAFFLFVRPAFAEISLNYQAVELLRTEQIHYDKNIDFDLYDFSDSRPSFTFQTRTFIQGSLLKRFNYEDELYQNYLSKEDFASLMARIHSLNLKSLDTKEPQAGVAAWTSGELKIGTEVYAINAPSDRPELIQLNQFLRDFCRNATPRVKWEDKAHRIEGDQVPAIDITFQELMSSPQTYDGKRIWMQGFFHTQFEGSSFSPGPDSKLRWSLWPGANSFFAKNVKRPQDKYVVLEGSFKAGPGGHMGMSDGEIQRITLIKVLPDSEQKPNP